MSARSVALLLFALASSSRAQPAQEARDGDDVALAFRPQLSLHLGYDSNARRVPHSLQASQGALPSSVVGDGLLVASVGATGSAITDGLALRGTGQIGTKLFFDQHKPPATTPDWARARAATTTATERMLVAQASGNLVTRLPLELTSRIDALAKARLQASGARTYALSHGRWVLSRGFGFGLSARGGVAGSVFHSASTPLYSSFGGGALAGGTFAATARESVDMETGVDLRAFPFARPVPPPGNVDVRRLDLPLRLSITFTSVRRIFLSGGYGLVRNLSATVGETYTRHRLWGMLGFKLPADVTASVRGTLQTTRYDDGISVAQQLFLREDDESQNSVSLGLSRAWAYGISLEGRLAWYGNELAQGGIEFSRTTAELGVRMAL